MKYPKPVEPFKDNYEMLAWLFGNLSAAYSIISQYENDERRRAREEMLDTFEKKKKA